MAARTEIEKRRIGHGHDQNLEEPNARGRHISEGLDAVIRVGNLPASTLVSRKIGEQRLVVCASPAYLRTHGVPQTPAELDDHACLMFRIPSTGLLRPWQFKKGRKTIDMRPPSRVAMNDGEALVASAAAGMGLAQVPTLLAAGEIAAGRLIEVLKVYAAPPVPISVVYPSTKRMTPRLRALIEALTIASDQRRQGG